MKEENIYETLAKIQAELKVPKSQFNKFGGYKFRSNEGILTAVKPVAKKYGCVVIQNDEMVMIGDRFYCKATTVLHNGKDYVSSDGYAREPLVQKGVSESQLTGTASSYARKYSANGLFALDETEVDPDHKDNRNHLPNLVINTEPFDKAKEWLETGGDIEKIKTKYNLTQTVEKALLS